MEKKTYSIIFFTSLAVIAAALLLWILIPRDRSLTEYSEEERLQAYLLLLEDLPMQSGDYLEYIRSHSSSEEFDLQAPVELSSPEELHRLSRQAREYSFSISKTGLYTPRFEYRRLDKRLGNFQLELKLDGFQPFSEARALELSRRWSDETKNFGRDRYNDETLPLQIPYQGWMSQGIFDSAGRTVEPLALYLEEGEHVISLAGLSTSAELELRSFLLEPVHPRQDYAEYRSSLSDTQTDGELKAIEINAIQYSDKNAYDVRLGSRDNPAATPYHRVDRLLNVVEGRSWERSGEEVSYTLEIPETGNYSLTLHYNNPKSDFSVFRSIRIDGEIPFQQMESYEFPVTGISRFGMETLSNQDHEPYRFYLTEGTHRISFKAEKEPISDASRALKMIIAHMNYFGIEIMKVTGKEVDKNRTWRLSDYLPKTADYLNAYHILVTDIIRDLSLYSDKGVDSAVTSSLYTALFKLEKLAEDPDELPIYLNDIYSTSIYDRPITQILGDTVTMLEDSEMSLNAFFLEQEPRKRKANGSLLSRAISSFSSLLSTFASEKYVTRNDEDVLNIWVTRPITHTDLMQKMADADFTRKTGIAVKVSVMPDPNRLILATAADTTPDIAMGLPSYVPFDLAIRDAAYELTDFEDFWEFAGDFSPGAFIPYILNEKVYGMPETLDFHTLVYRRDIFQQLGLIPPDTWDDVINLLPLLQRYGMNFYHPVAGGLPTLKWFYQTSPFVYQFGGSLYSKDGLSVSLDDPRTVEGLRFQSELFSLYALQEQVPIFYNSFRFGIIPVGIVDSASYLQLKFAAPELKGQWALAPYPGIPDEEGNPQRWFIANGVASLIMKDSERPEDSWEFMKWWLSEETQAEFGYRLQSTYGPEYLWISANLNALADAPIEEAEKEVILEQVKWQRDVPRTPAQYMLERGLSDIWINSATKNRSVRTEIDKMIPVIEREVKRKMIEFGYIDTQGNSLKPFIVPDIQWVIDQMAPYKKEDSNE